MPACASPKERDGHIKNILGRPVVFCECFFTDRNLPFPPEIFLELVEILRQGTAKLVDALVAITYNSQRAVFNNAVERLGPRSCLGTHPQ